MVIPHLQSVDESSHFTRLSGESKQIDVLFMGQQSFEKSWNLQKQLVLKRQQQQIPDTLILVEHDPVYTIGKNGNENHLLQSRRPDVPVFHIERGGDVTYHGPGQIVGYPILDLNYHRKSVSWYMRSLEEVVIETLNKFGIASHRTDGFTGVWVGEQKIAALGVRISRWVTMHGFALNVNTDLSFYNGIIPCGIFEYGITSMEKCLHKRQNIVDVKNATAREFCRIFNYRQVRKLRNYF